MFKSTAYISLIDSKLVEWKQLRYIKRFGMNRSVLTPSATMEFELSKSNMGLRPQSETDIDADVLDVQRLMTVGSMVRLYIDDCLQFTGYITSLNPKAGIDGDLISVKCKDIIWRLQNTTLYHQRPLAGNQGVMSLVRHALDGLRKPLATGAPGAWDPDDIFKGITIYESQALHIGKVTGKQPDADLESDTELIKESDAKPKENENAYDFIKRMLKPWGYLMQATSEGALQIFRPNTKDSARYTFKHKNDPRKVYDAKTAPILGSPSLMIDIENMHSGFFVYGSAVQDDSNRLAVKAYYENPDFPKDENGNQLCRCIEFIYDHNLQTQPGCLKRAKRAAGFEVARFYQYQWNIAGFGLDSTVFSNDIVVQIEDEFNGVASAIYVTEIRMTGTPTEQSTYFVGTLTTALLLE